MTTKAQAADTVGAIGDEIDDARATLAAFAASAPMPDDVRETLRRHCERLELVSASLVDARARVAAAE